MTPAPAMLMTPKHSVSMPACQQVHFFLSFIFSLLPQHYPTTPSPNDNDGSKLLGDQVTSTANNVESDNEFNQPIYEVQAGFRIIVELHS